MVSTPTPDIAGPSAASSRGPSMRCQNVATRLLLLISPRTSEKCRLTRAAQCCAAGVCSIQEPTGTARSDTGRGPAVGPASGLGAGGVIGPTNGVGPGTGAGAGTPSTAGAAVNRPAPHLS